MGRALLVATIWGLLLLITGCAFLAGPAKPPELDSLPEPNVIYGKILEQAHAVKTLRGTARVRIQTEEGSRRLDALIACDREGRLRLEVMDFLGHVLFLALIRDGTFAAYSITENQYLEKPADPETLQEVVGVATGWEGLIALALGSPIFIPMESPSLRIGQDHGLLILDAEDPTVGLHYRIRLDAQGRPTQSKCVSTRAGLEERVMQVDFERYQGVNHIAFPFRILVKDETGQRSLSVRYQDIFLNETLDEDLFRFVPPASAGELKW